MSGQDFLHETVLLQEAVDALVTDTQGIYIDGTFGRGGHTRRLLSLLQPEARVLGFDKDPMAIAASERLAAQDARFECAHASFAELKQQIEARHWAGKINGILLEPLLRTRQLADLIEKAVPVREKHKHPATRAFQGIRIFINRELDDLTDVLQQAVDVLAPGGRLVVISFHSLEDRIVKQFIQRKEKGDPLPRHLPVRHQDVKRELRSVMKQVRASDAEVARNPRARSAIMRVAERVTS